MWMEYKGSWKQKRGMPIITVRSDHDASLIQQLVNVLKYMTPLTTVRGLEVSPSN